MIPQARSVLVLLALASLGFASFSSSPVAAADWAQWRGPGRDGHLPAGQEFPQKLPADPLVAWRIKVGDGLSSPVTAAGRVFYLDNVDGKETVHAINDKTGQSIWSQAVDEAFKDSQSASGPRCT